MGVYTSAEQLIGGTPLLELNRTVKAYSLPCRILAKLEFMNIGGSVKDRVAKAMLDEAEKAGHLKPGGTVIEPTSGNTGIGLCAVAAARGYRCVIVMPDTMSIERRRILTALGAQLVLTPGSEGMDGSIRRGEELSREIPGSFLAAQFDDPANPEAHYLTTGPEIWTDTQGKVDLFIAGIGTGGTISGVGKYLKEQNPNIRIVGVEPEDSPVLTQGKAGPHGIQGIGAGFIPNTLNRAILDQVITVSTQDAYAAGRRMGTTEGILCGISSGAALHAAKILAQRPENAGKTIVVLLPDSGERYLSTAMYDLR
jgi:cysteine synthase A